MLRRCFAATAFLFLAACGGSGNEAPKSETGETKNAETAEKYVVSGAYVRKPLDGQTSTAAYFSLKSNASANSLIFNVTADKAETAELHSHDMSGGLMKMRKLDNIEIEAGDTLEFAAFGHHIMLFDVDEGLEIGDDVQLTLDIFTDGSSEQVSFSAPVKPL